MKNILLTTVIIITTLISCNKPKVEENWNDIPQAKVVEEKKITFSNQGVTKKPAFEPNVLLVGLKDNSTKAKVFARNTVMKFIHTVAMIKKGSNGINKIRSENVRADSL